MSRLKELRLHGFKSFADPTRFIFEPGVNAVIGPNGSGKSNMADAVRWVLGEQSNRSLRTRRTDDVIFAGSEGRRAQGMAEVILTLDNGDGWLPIDFAEVSVGRRAYRSGESEYLINGARARLRDVVELLAGGRLGANELVVLGQGTVDAALSLRPEERRQLFEEAAGVKNLQVRKNEATSRLVRARDNLTRVADLIGELRPQVRRLALQAEHQQQHAALVARARSLIEETHRRREQAAHAALGAARRAAAAAEAALEGHRAEQERSRAAVAATEARYWEAEAAARRAAEEHAATREAAIQADVRQEALGARRREQEARIAAGETELAAATAELALRPEREDARLTAALDAAAAAEEEWREAVAALADADSELLSAEEALAELRSRESAGIAAAARRAEEQARAAARRERAAQEEATARSELARAREAAALARDERSAADEDLAQALRALEEAGVERDGAQTAADEGRRHAVELGERLSAVRAELSALEERVEHGGRLGSLLAAAGWRSLLDSVEIPEEAWPAIEALVGGELEQTLLWRDGDVAAALRDVRGAARLLEVAAPPPPGREAALTAVGATRTLAEWVGPDRSPALFHRTVVAPDVAALLHGWRRLPHGWCAVTPQGDLADARGVLLVRGRGEPLVSVAAEQHQRRRELADSLGRLESERAAAADAAHEAAERLRQERDRHLATHGAADDAEREMRRALAGADGAELEVTRAGRELDRLEAEQAELATQSAAGSPPGEATQGVGPELQQLEQRAAGARTRRATRAAARDAAREAWSLARQAAEAAEAGSGSRLGQRAVLEARSGQLQADLAADRQALAALVAELNAGGAEAGSAGEADERAARVRAEADQARDARRVELLELERGSSGASARLGELERAAQAAAVEASRRDDALAALARERELAVEGLPEHEHSGLGPDEEAAHLPGLDEEQLAAELGRVRRTLGQIGSVNPFAVEEHHELANRLDELAGQDADLRGAIGSTEELIATLEAQITEQFDAAFRAIGQRFDEYCRLLFAGGSASLQLADEADGDAPGGIEIVVQPPGKRLQRLAMLSGGERALTGVALLFAMLSVNPIPFCILDEVDAALDEANIGRFAEALRRLAESIDFVVITHNRATIEVADTIYGVTMTDAAVSRVLSLRLADVPVEVGA